jgi:hypothetical protein
MKKSWIGTTDLVELLYQAGFTKVRESGSRIILRNERLSFVLSRRDDISLSILKELMLIATKSGDISRKQFIQFIASKAPLTAEFLLRSTGGASSNRKSIDDKILRQRLQRLGTAPLDTIIREAGVILEDRIRQVANETDQSLHGISLVDAVLTPGKAKIVFSKLPAEQDGARLLFRGAIQFIRNPAMHHLIDYPEKEADIFLQVIDSLLQLLDRVQAASG